MIYSRFLIKSTSMLALCLTQAYANMSQDSKKYNTQFMENNILPQCQIDGSYPEEYVCIFDYNWADEMSSIDLYANNVRIQSKIFYPNDVKQQQKIEELFNRDGAPKNKKFKIIYSTETMHKNDKISEIFMRRIGTQEWLISLDDLKKFSADDPDKQFDVSTNLNIRGFLERYNYDPKADNVYIRQILIPEDMELKEGDYIPVDIPSWYASVFLFYMPQMRIKITPLSDYTDCILRDSLGDINGFDVERCDLQVTLYNASVPNAADPDGVPGTTDGSCSISSDSPLYGYFQPCAIYRNSNNQLPLRIELNAYRWKKTPDGGHVRDEIVELPQQLARRIKFTFEIKNNSPSNEPEYHLPNIAEKLKFGDERNMYTLGSASGCTDNLEYIIPDFHRTKGDKALGIIKYVTADKKFESLVSNYPISIEIKSVTIGSQTLSPENYKKSGIVKLDLLKDEQLNKDGTTALDNQGNIPILGGDALVLKDQFSHDYTLPGISNSEYFYAYLYNILTPSSSRIAEDKKLCYAKVELKAFKSLVNTYYPLDPNQYLKPEATFDVNPYLFTESYNSKWYFNPEGHNTTYMFENGLQTLFGINSGTFAGIRATIDQSYTPIYEQATVWVDKDPKIERNKRVIYGGTYFKVFGNHNLPELLFPQRIVITTQHGTSYQRYIAIGETTPGKDPSPIYYDLTGNNTKYCAWS
ncbi:hypothetical protein [Cysteiniphilum sp. QT6929]|uniref:hypothetical protein n=1 Tax=Cysteiniphilum sp. QT6929 TaxID=2975055 RepID=UPI0024B394C0|nr:hypothetical protein [Cysteiniphilum sp. QT6929]WHN66492.1 hypothetical protein NYP54_04495 [Cysteiniphilum sp. QT6929]